MRIDIIAVLIISLFLTTTAGAQNVTINATGKGYENTCVRVYTYSDPVSLQLVPLMTTVADDNGSFRIESDFYKPGQLIIKAGIYNLSLFFEPGKSYELSLPPFRNKTKDDELNPFFRESKLIAEVLNDTLCLNNLIRDFETEYNIAYDALSESIFYNTGKERMQMLTEALKKYPVTDSIGFYSDYVRYRKSVLDIMTFNSDADKIESTLYLNQKTDIGNPACTELVSRVYNNYLKSFAGEDLKPEISSAIYKGSFSRLKNAAEREKKISNDELLEYVLLMNLYEEFYSGGYRKEELIKIIDDLAVTSTYTTIRTISAVILEKLNRFVPGRFPPALSLVNQVGDSVSLNDYKGKYLLLSFARSDSYASISEFSIIKMWQDKYYNDLKLLTILTDNDFTDSSAKMEKAGYNWELLDGSDSERLIFNYEIKVYPLFILIGRDGKIIMAPSLLPSEELEAMISDRIMKERVRSDLLK